MNTRYIIMAGIFGGLSVVAGAFLAHQLKQQMPPAAIEVYDTAVRYQFYHVFALLSVGILSERFGGAWMNWAGKCFIAGILLFSGSLFIISVLMTIGHSVPVPLGICTPLGGLGYILGWIFLTIAVSRGRAS